MKIVAGILLVFMTLACTNSFAENVVVEPTDRSIGNNLDLRAVAALFGQSETLEDFENRLNNPDIGISNLDLNKDGHVDYLRVVEAVRNDTHLITIQAVLDKDLFQDVATIELEQKSDKEVTAQIVGNDKIYGEDYIIRPAYPYIPIFSRLFRGPHYRPWRSPFFWGHYPQNYRPWSPYSDETYREHVQVHVNGGTMIRYSDGSSARMSVETPKKGAPRVLGTRQLRK